MGLTYYLLEGILETKCVSGTVILGRRRCNRTKWECGATWNYCYFFKKKGITEN